LLTCPGVYMVFGEVKVKVITALALVKLPKMNRLIRLTCRRNLNCKIVKLNLFMVLRLSL
jgi:hypothetical protein